MKIVVHTVKKLHGALKDKHKEEPVTVHSGKTKAKDKLLRTARGQHSWGNKS
jgi:hypothetical protein